MVDLVDEEIDGLLLLSVLESSAKPSRPARELSDTTGKTTLMEVAVTPRVLVLAWSTGVGRREAVKTADRVPGPAAAAVTVDAARTQATPTTRATVQEGADRRRPRRRRGRCRRSGRAIEGGLTGTGRVRSSTGGASVAQ